MEKEVHQIKLIQIEEIIQKYFKIISERVTLLGTE